MSNNQQTGQEMSQIETIVLGGGCFWCQEAIFARVKGVVRVESGYAGGKTGDPSYEEVSTGRSGHAEVVRVEYDSETISTKQILELFFKAHDPTTKDRQGADVGSQYRSIILYTTEEQKEMAKRMMKPNWVTEIKPLDKFFRAEDYHQHYFEKNSQAPYCQVVIEPKLKKLFED